nr:lasso peptide biosynthesis B2 protein [Streptomyces chattanoogensis]
MATEPSAALRIWPLSVTTSAAEAGRVVVARDWASRFFLGRASCLEMSLAASLASTLHGRAVDWYMGCRFAPCESHAWIEVDSPPIGEPGTPDHPFKVTLRT